MERLVWGFGDGSTLPVFDDAARKLGAVICWENYMPLLRMAMYAKGIQLYCAPTADDRDTWLSTMQHVALEGRCFVFSACQHLRRADCPADYAAIQGDDPATVLMRGGSAIIGPLGQVLAGPVFNENAILTADIDLGEDHPRQSTTSTSSATTRGPTSSGCTSTKSRRRPSSSSSRLTLPAD